MEDSILTNYNAIRVNGERYDLAGAMDALDDAKSKNDESEIHLWELISQLLDSSKRDLSFFSSGSTGAPKEIVFSKEKVYQSAMNTCNFFGLEEGSKFLLCLPVKYTGGKMMVVRCMVNGGDLITTGDGLNPLEGVNLKTDFAAFTPTQVDSILKDTETLKKFSQVGTAIIGGGVLDEALEVTLTKIGIEVYATYGMTETLSHIAVRKVGQKDFCPVYGNMKLTTDDNGRLLINLPFVQESVITTNDMVDLKDDGSFQWVARYDDIINSGGVKINPLEIEKVISGNGFVLEGEFYVGAEKNRQFGEVPILVMKENIVIGSIESLMGKINELLPAHQRIKGYKFVDHFEKTPTGKLKRKRW